MSNPSAAKSMFAQTCSLLREYVKEKGPLLAADFTFSTQGTQPADYKLRNLSSMDLFSPQADRASTRGHHTIKESATKEAAQMTIFYGGRIMVLNVPSGKAEEVMRLASKAASSDVPASAPADLAAAVPHLNSSGRRTRTHSTNRDDASRSFQATSHQSIVADLPINIVADLPIKRKTSLSLFLEKRKNRINARAPYNMKGKESSKSADKKPWLELAAHSHNNS